MSIWILLWVLVSTFLLGFWLWSTYTLFKQKQAWRVYAEKRKMRYDSGKFYDPPTIAGTIDGYKIEIFTGDHTRFDARAERHLTGVEISLHTYLPVSTVVATGGMVTVVQATQLPQEYKPEYPGWDDSYVVYTAESGVASAYLTSKRLDHILELLKIKNAWLVLIFMNGRGLLRLDFPDPILDPKNLDQLIKKMIAAAQTFELEKGEDISVMRKSRQIRDGQSVIKVDDEILSEKPRFELEDD